MDKKLQNKLFRKYPDFFQDRKQPTNVTRMYDGICCGDGWYNLIDEVCDKLDLFYNISGCEPIFFQIKEKFAGLRIYIDRIEDNEESGFTKKDQLLIDQIIRLIISDAMNQSYFICEECGEHRKDTKKLGSWYYAMCDKCWKKFLKKRTNKRK